MSDAILFWAGQIALSVFVLGTAYLAVLVCAKYVLGREP